MNQILEWTEELRVNAQWRNEYLILGIDVSDQETEEVDREFLVLNVADGNLQPLIFLSRQPGYMEHRRGCYPETE